MKKSLFYILIFCVAISCYKDNGEPLRSEKTSSGVIDLDYEIAPCESSINFNNIHFISGGYHPISPVRGVGGGKYIPGYQVKGWYSDQLIKIEFLTKPTINKIYTTTISNSNNVDQCCLYITNVISNVEYFSRISQKVYVDTMTPGKLSFNFCGTRFSNLANTSVFDVDNFNITVPN